MADATLNTQGGALLPNNNGQTASQSAFGTPTALNSFISTLPNIPNPTPPAPKTLTVVTPQAAQNDLATKQDTTAQVSNAVSTQAQNKLAAVVQPPATTATAQPTTQQPTPTPTTAAPTSQYTPGKDDTPVTLPNGVSAYYNNTTQQLTTATGQQLQFNDQAGWIDPATGLPPAPAGTTAATNVPSTGDATTDYINQQYASNQAAADKASADHQAQLAQLLNGTFPLTADQQSQVTNLQGQFAQLAQLQKTANDNYTGAMTVLGVSSGRSQYAPEIEQGQIKATIDQGISKIAAIDAQAADAVASLKQGFYDKDYTLINQAYKDLTDAQDAKTTTLKNMQDTVKQQIDAQTAKIQNQTATLANTTAKITSIASSALQQSLKADGTIDLDALQAIADNNKIDVNALYGAVQKEQQTENLAQQADTKFASDQLQAKATLAKTNADTASTQATTAKTNLEAAALAPTSPNDPAAAAALDPNSQSILAQTGLSVAAFNYLTQGTAALSRLSASDRKAIQNEASDFLNKNGLDYSTFQSQYKAQNNVLQNNIERAANTKVFAGEVSGTAQQFINDVGSDISNLKPANVLQLLVGGQTNDATVQKYAFDLQTMQNDLAGYYAASRGANSPDQSDLSAAANVISSGLSGKGAQAFKDSIDSNEKKVTGVVNKSVTDAQQSVWNQFGVGDKYNPSASTTGAGTSGGAGKGSQSASQFVESTLKAQNLKYDDVIAKAKATIASNPSLKGTQPALDNSTGETVFATPAEISSGSYTPL